MNLFESRRLMWVAIRPTEMAKQEPQPLPRSLDRAFQRRFAVQVFQMARLEKQLRRLAADRAHPSAVRLGPTLRKIRGIGRSIERFGSPPAFAPHSEKLSQRMLALHRQRFSALRKAGEALSPHQVPYLPLPILALATAAENSDPLSVATEVRAQAPTETLATRRHAGVLVKIAAHAARGVRDWLMYAHIGQENLSAPSGERSAIVGSQAIPGLD